MPDTFSLQPVAQPTNQFVQPYVAPPQDLSTTPLSQLARSLSQVVPQLSQTLQKRVAAQQANSQAQADQDFMQQRYKNTAALQQAVKDGKIAQSDNPWYMVQLRQDVAANEANDAVKQMQVDWETSPVRFSDDPTAVEDWGKQQLASVTDGRDAYESEAIAPVIQQGLSQLLSRHMEVRRSERQDERVANFQQRVSDLLTGPDPKANAAGLQALIADARLTMPGSLVNQLVIHSAQDSAEATGDEGILDVLGQLPNSGAGGTLADTPEIKKLAQDLPLMRLRRSEQIDTYLQKQQKAQQEQTKQNLEAALLKAGNGDPSKALVTPDMAKQSGLSWEDVIDINTKALNYGKLLDDQEGQRADRIDKANRREAEALSGQTEAGIVTGSLKIDDPKVADARARMAAFSPETLNQFDMFIRDQQQMGIRMDRTFASDSDPQTYADLWNMAKAGTLTQQALIPQANKLSHEDWTKLFHETVKTDSDTKLSSFPMSNYDDLIEQSIVFPKANGDAFGGDYQLASKDPGVQHAVTLAKTEFAEDVQNLLTSSDFSKLPRDQQTTRLAQLRDAVVQKYGGVTEDKRQQLVEQQQKQATAAKQQAAAALQKGVEFKDGVGTMPDGTTFGTPTVLTDEARKQVGSLAEALAAANPDPTRSLSQIYAGQTTRKGWQALLFRPANDFRNRDEMVLAAFVHNAGLLNAGSFGATPSMRVTDSLVDPKLTADSFSDVQTSARIDFMQQRQQLAALRRQIGEQWITDQRQEKLLKLTASMTGKLSAMQPVSAKDAFDFQELADKFRLYDFLGVTAGVDRDDIQRDYRVLYKYPAAASLDEFVRMGPFLARFVPRKEFEAVQTAQRSLIENAHDLLVNGRYTP